MSDEIATSVRNLTLAGAQQAIEAALQYCRDNDEKVDIAVCDRAGHLVAFVRMDGAPLLSMSIAQDKAYTVAAFGPDTREWWGMIKDEPPLLHGIVKTDRLQIFAGGVKLTVDGETVGAIGVSGSTAEGDQRIADAGAAAVNS